MTNIFKVKGKKDIGALLISIIIAEGLGFIAGIFNSMASTTYINLKRPWFSPPSIVFQIVWPILYLLMAIAAYRIYMLGKEGVDVKKPLILYAIQLILNFLWSFIFFNFKLYGLAFIELIILFIFIVLTTISFFRKDKIAGLLMIPYLIWVAFAGILNFYIWYFNEM